MKPHDFRVGRPARPCFRPLLATACASLLAASASALAGSIEVAPDPLVVGGPFTITVQDPTVVRGTVTVDFRPAVTRMMRLSLAMSGSDWLAQGTVPGDIEITGPVPVQITAVLFPATGPRFTLVKQVILEPVPTTVGLTVSGRVLFTDGEPVVGAEVNASLFDEALQAAVTSAWQMSPEPPATLARGAEGAGAPAKAPPLSRQDRLQAALALMPLAAAAAAPAGTQTDAEGRYTLELEVPALPARVTLAVSFQETGLPAVQSGLTRTVDQPVSDLGDILLPRAEAQQMTLQLENNVRMARSLAGDIIISNVAPEVVSLFSQSFDPDESPEAFPGEFAELGRVPLNSTVFLWIEALDAEGNPVDDLSQASTIRSLVPRTQWADLEDIQSGTDRIEIPIYVFNEDNGMWEFEGNGWLEDGAGTVLPEDVESLIVDGSFDGEIYAVFVTTHFSWMNVDYPYIGPWTLSRIPPERRNDDCLYNAMQLAKTIARSAAGRTTYTKFNTPTGDLDVELADGAGPELKTDNLNGAYGEFKGNEKGDRDDQLYLDNSLWNGCQAGATDAQKKNTTLMMAVTLVHETAHWKWDTKHDGGNWTNREPGGEAGNELEKDLFGGIITGGPDGIKSDGAPVDDATRDGWLNPDNWPPPAGGRRASGLALAAAADPEPSPLEITISVPKTSYDLGEEIVVTVEYRNVGSEPLSVLTLNELEGYPLAFEIVRQGEPTRVPFRGQRLKRDIDYQTQFAELAPSETLAVEVPLLFDPTTGERRYFVNQSGTYDLQAFYSHHYGLPETASNPLTIEIGGGGQLQGNVNNATTLAPIAGASVKVFQGATELATTTTDASGNYDFPELAPGSYSMRVSAPLFLTSTRDDVVVTVGETTVANFSLSSLIAQGQMRIVLNWGAQPSDLDSHLWLPAETPYHLAYFRMGNTLACPFARLDVDDTSGFGPETVTIAGKYPGRYLYAVNLFCCGSTMAGTGAQVQVFDQSGLIASYTAPATGNGVWWHVMAIDGETGTITEINQVGDDPRPYVDTAAGCEGQECPPEWVHDGFRSECTPPPCPDGSFHDGFSSECVPTDCSPDTYHDGLSSGCIPFCPSGWIHDALSSGCTPDCPEGWYHDGELSNCTVCPRDEFHDGEFSTCTPWCTDPGTYHNAFSSECFPFECEPGLFHDACSSGCVVCPPGSYHEEATSACLEYCPDMIHDACSSTCLPLPALD